jgi:hypothetical protein
MADGVDLPYASALQSEKGRQQVVDALKVVKNELAAQSLIEMLNENDKIVNRLKKTIRAYVGEDNPTMKLLTGIPGCGEVTAWTILAFTDDIKKFATPKKYAAYCGLVPWVKDSNQTVCHGSITKRGPAELRTAMVEIVMGLLRQKEKYLSWRLMERYGRIKRGKGSGKAIIATARKISKVVWHMLTHNEPFNTSLMADKKAAEKARQMSDKATAQNNTAVEESAAKNNGVVEKTNAQTTPAVTLAKKAAKISDKISDTKNIIVVAATSTAAAKHRKKPSPKRRL